MLTMLLSVGVTDPLTNRLLKPWVHRSRPCAAFPAVLTPDGDRGTFSFPSAHAANSAGAAVVAGLNFPNLAAPAGALALLIGLSRIYLGLHYPSDALGGWALGALCGWACWSLAGLIERRRRGAGPPP
jgi:undecaprenyl-diphosphatase